MMPVLELDGVSRTYAGEVPVHALRGVSFKISASEQVAIVGPSGSGKSTLLGVLGCLDAPSSGSLRICGQEVRGLSDGDRTALRRDTIGFVFQQFYLIPHLTARGNVEAALLYRGLTAGERQTLATTALGRVGLISRMEHRPAKLSGGEQQRVALARAVVTEPSLILADEPTGNLDSVNARRMMQLLVSFAGEGAAVVVVTHDHAIASEFPRRIVMGDGQVVQDERA
jgi:putative ABC transport system ATP-binding protein